MSHPESGKEAKLKDATEWNNIFGHFQSNNQAAIRSAAAAISSIKGALEELMEVRKIRSGNH